jgi:hypothetical protein
MCFTVIVRVPSILVKIQLSIQNQNILMLSVIGFMMYWMDKLIQIEKIHNDDNRFIYDDKTVAYAKA